MKMYIFGEITLNEFSDHVTALGYAPGDVTLLVQELLILAKVSAERAAKAAAHQAAPKVAHLSEAKLETAYLDGIIGLDTYKTVLLGRGYSVSDVDTAVAELRIKAGLQEPNPPTA